MAFVVCHKLKSGWWTTTSVEADSNCGETEGHLLTYGGAQSLWDTRTIGIALGRRLSAAKSSVKGGLGTHVGVLH